MITKAQFVAETSLKGVKPALQERSLQRRNELFKAGMELLCEKGIDDVSVVDIAAKCGYSVGTFYSRFDDKESFFHALQIYTVNKALSQVIAEFSRDKWKTEEPEVIFRKAVEYLISIFRGETKGVIKESIVRSRDREEAWVPIRDSGRQVADVIVDLLKDKLYKNNIEASELSIRFGLQMVYGTLIQSLLNDPGPVLLDDPRLEDYLTRMLCGYVQLEGQSL